MPWPVLPFVGVVVVVVGRLPIRPVPVSLTVSSRLFSYSGILPVALAWLSGVSSLARSYPHAILPYSFPPHHQSSASRISPSPPFPTLFPSSITSNICLGSFFLSFRLLFFLIFTPRHPPLLRRFPCRPHKPHISNRYSSRPALERAQLAA